MAELSLPQYKQAFREIVVQNGAYGFWAHLVVYILINIMIVIFNLVNSPAIIWFYFPLFGWGLGLFMHYLFGYRWLSKLLNLLESRAEVRAGSLRQKNGLSGDITLGEYKKAFRQIIKEDSFAGFIVHLIAFIAVNIMLTIADVIYNPERLWFFFPLFGWGAGLIIHYLLGLRWVERFIKSLELLAENKSREASIFWFSEAVVHRNDPDL
ncbi:MAG TPA: 2TM domain-containing protein [Bacillota bacterium]|nr:2TM domain-containing protein [Bacillota bacterium]